MADVNRITRWWPLLFAAVGVAGLAYSAWKWFGPHDPSLVPELDVEEPVVDPGPDHHFERVRALVVDDDPVPYRGVVKAEAPVPVRAPRGMLVPVVKIHHEAGDFVKKGEPLLTFAKEQIDQAIERAQAEGKIEDEKRFRSYLDYAVLKSPVDGVVGEMWCEVGKIPIDDGPPLLNVVDKSGFRFVVSVPAEVQRLSMPIGKKFDVELDDDLGIVAGTVAEYGAPVGQDVPVVLALEPHKGIEERLAGTIRVVPGKKEVGLVPRAAIVRRGDVDVVRVWDPDSRSIGDKTIRGGGDVGEDRIVLAGVFVGDQIVVPGRRHD